MNLLTATPGRRARLVRRRRRTRPGTPAGPRFGPTGQFRLSARCGQEPLTSRAGALTRRGPVRRSSGAFRPVRRRESWMGAFRPPSSLSSRNLPLHPPEATDSGWPADPALRHAHDFQHDLEFSPVLASTDPAESLKSSFGHNERSPNTHRASADFRGAPTLLHICTEMTVFSREILRLRGGSGLPAGIDGPKTTPARRSDLPRAELTDVDARSP